jgi:hypothetical protein
LDGSVRRHARGACRAALLVPRQRPSTFTTRWREALVHRLGGLLPVWRGGLGIEGHVRSARAVVDAGAVFVQMPEGTVNGPVGRLGPFRPGAALIALRTGATIVPLAMAGTEELYIGRRMALARAAADLAPRAARRRLGRHAPVPESREELALASAPRRALAALLEPSSRSCTCARSTRQGGRAASAVG